MSRLYLLLLSVLLPAAALCAQQDTRVRQAPPRLLDKFDVHAGTLQTLSLPAAVQDGYALPVQLGGDTRTMTIHLHDVRAPGFQLFVQDGAGLQPQPTPPCVTYRGTLVEEPTARVAATVVDGTIEAMIYRAPTGPGLVGETWVVQPVRKIDPTATPSLHVVYRAIDTKPLPYQCGTNTAGAPQSPANGGGADVSVVCEIAIEADLQYYQANGSNVTQTQNNITTVMNQVDFIYDRDCDVTFTVTTIIVTTTNVYTTNDAGQLLSQFRSRWNNNFGSVQRDVAHLFTGRNLTGSTIGVAYLSVVCNLGSAYGLSQSGFTGNLNSRVGLTCHELGHNFSAPHCNGANPCYIMCSGLGGCSNNVTLFSPTAIGQISGFASNASCLPPAPVAPTLTSVTPSTVTVFDPGNVVLTGSGFTGVTSYDVGGQTYTTGFTVANDSTMSIAMPPGTAVGPTTVRVTNPLGTSNSLPIGYTLTQPPKLVATTLIPALGGTATFDFGGTPNNQWFLIVGLGNATTPFQGFDLLSNPILFTFGTFSGPLGVESLSVPVPGGLGFLLLYTQILEGDATGSATGVSNLRVLILQ